jgi:hypothetical protein
MKDKYHIPFIQNKMAFTRKQIQAIVTLLKFLHLSVFVLTFLTLMLLVDHDFTNIFSNLWVLPALAISLVIFIGLHQRRSWIVPTVILLSILGLIGGLLSVPEELPTLVGKWMRIFVSIFQIYFFTRPEVRSYFGSSAHILF